MVGHETSAGVISYTLHALCADQQRQDKLRAELSAAGFCATSDVQGKEPTYDELVDSKTLPYLDAVVKEAYVILFSALSECERCR
jgi:cytochrome P450